MLALAALAAALLVVPLLALMVRAPWRDFASILTSSGVLRALRLSLLTASLSTVLSLLLGVPLAWVLARTQFVGRSLLRALVTVPLVLPPVVGGVALLVAFGRRGLVGQWLYDAFGLQLTYTATAVVIAQTFVAMPFLVISVEGGLRATDRRFEDVAATLGASGWTTFRRVTLPAIVPAVLAGAVLAWARALGEFGATITFAGSFPGRTQTMPILAYVDINAGDLDSAIVVSLLLLVTSVLILIGLRDRWLVRA